MKKIIVTIIVFAAFKINAQKAITKDSLIKVMSIDVCAEIEKTLNSGKKIDNMEAELGFAMLPSISKYSKEIKSIYGEDAFEGNTMEKVGEEMGVYMATNCPAFLKLFAANSGGKSSAEETKTLEGTFTKLTLGELSFIEVKASSGKIEKLYWFEYFEGSNDLVNNSNALNNKKVKIEYIEKEIYKASIKDYVKVKIIHSINSK